jgi:carbon storage regulator
MALVLSRKRDEMIRIGAGITVMVVEIRGDRVKLGISADPSIPINREEVHRMIQQGGDARHEAREGAVGAAE